MKGLVYLLCGLAGGIAGAAAFDALRGDTPARAAPETRTVVDTTRDEAVARLERRVDELATLVATLRGASPAPGGTDTAAGATDGAPERLPGAADPGAGTAADADVDAVVRGLAGRRFGYSEFGRLFNWSLNNKDKIRTLIAALEREIEADPTNADLRVALASAWVGELTNNTPAGPQQGMVWVKAEAAYNKALELDPNHWQGRFGKAFGTSMVPEFLGMRPAAIKQFEELRVLQEQGAPEPHHEQTYFRLGTLYKDAGNTEKALEIWNEGLRRFPQSEQLKGTLEVSTKK